MEREIEIRGGGRRRRFEVGLGSGGAGWLRPWRAAQSLAGRSGSMASAARKAAAVPVRVGTGGGCGRHLVRLFGAWILPRTPRSLIRWRMWMKDLPDWSSSPTRRTIAATAASFLLNNAGEETCMFTVEVAYNGLFCDPNDNLEYVSSTTAHFDNCTADTWSLFWIDEILRNLGEKRDGKLHVYWCLPDKEIWNGLVLVEDQSVIYQMIKASWKHKTLVLFVDHNDFFGRIRPDIPMRITSVPKARKAAIAEKDKVRAEASGEAGASSSSCVLLSEKRKCTNQDAETEVVLEKRKSKSHAQPARGSSRCHRIYREMIEVLVVGWFELFVKGRGVWREPDNFSFFPSLISFFLLDG